MAHDNHANYAKIGALVVVGLVVIIGALMWFGGYGDRNDTFICETYYDHPVTGLSVGSEVNFRGVKVGEVRDISFVVAEYDDVADEDEQVICIRMALSRRLCNIEDDEENRDVLDRLVAKGLRATVTSSGITGLSKVELNLPRAGTDPVPVRRLSWVPDHLWIPSAPSMLESFSDSATRMMRRLDTMDLATTWSNVTRTVDSAASAMQTASALVDSQQAHLDQTLTAAEEAARAVRELADTLKDNPSLLLRPADPDPLPETAR